MISESESPTFADEPAKPLSFFGMRYLSKPKKYIILYHFYPLLLSYIVIKTFRQSYEKAT